MTGQSGAARRYAQALLDVARESADPEQVRGELAQIAVLLQRERALRTLLANPAVGVAPKQKVVAGLGRKGKWSPLVQRLMAMLVDRGRTELLPGIERAYVASWNAERGVIEAEAVSATALEARQRTALAKAIQSATGRAAEVESRVDPELLGGIVLRMGGRTYDASVRSRLAGLRRRLAGAGGA